MHAHWNLMAEAAKYGYRNETVDEMFGYPNKVAGMWVSAFLLSTGNMILMFAKNKQDLVVPSHSIYASEDKILRHDQHLLPPGAKPEEVISHYRKTFKPSKVEIKVISK